MSLLGLVAFLALAWGISLRRGPFPWRTVLAGMALQLILAALLIRKSPFSEWVYSNAKIAADNLADLHHSHFHANVAPAHVPQMTKVV